MGHQIGKDRDSRILCRLRMDLLGAKLDEGPGKALGRPWVSLGFSGPNLQNSSGQRTEAEELLGTHAEDLVGLPPGEPLRLIPEMGSFQDCFGCRNSNCVVKVKEVKENNR